MKEYLCPYRLSEQAQKALESVGSSFSKQISFRDAWAFIGRSQLHGYSPFEEVLILLIWMLKRSLATVTWLLATVHDALTS